MKIYTNFHEIDCIISKPSLAGDGFDNIHSLEIYNCKIKKCHMDFLKIYYNSSYTI